MLRLTPGTIKTELETNGYVVCPNVLNKREIKEITEEFKKWQKTVPNHDKHHNNCDPHGLYKFHEAGHQRHAWIIRTHPVVQSYFKHLWNTDELIVSFDGSCYIPKELKKKTTYGLIRIRQQTQKVCIATKVL